MRVNYKEKVRKRSGTGRGVPALFSLVLRKTQTILCPFPQYSWLRPQLRTPPYKAETVLFGSLTETKAIP